MFYNIPMQTYYLKNETTTVMVSENYDAVKAAFLSQVNPCWIENRYGVRWFPKVRRGKIVDEFPENV
jgi:hypothetical protein